MTASVTERVLNGAALLDRTTPGWESKVNLDTLNVASSTRCVLGQVFADPTSIYNNGYLLGTRLLGLNLDDVERCGFGEKSCNPLQRGNVCICDQKFRDLTAAWREFITARREEAGRSYVARAQRREMAA